MRDRLQSDACARALRALADPDRLRLVQCLQRGPRNVSELSELLGEEIANVSHHLRVLRQAGIVLHRKEGKFVLYSLHPDVFRPRDQKQPSDALDLGCCRLELGKP